MLGSREKQIGCFHAVLESCNNDEPIFSWLVISVFVTPILVTASDLHSIYPKTNNLWEAHVPGGKTQATHRNIHSV